MLSDRQSIDVNSIEGSIESKKRSKIHWNSEYSKI